MFNTIVNEFWNVFAHLLNEIPTGKIKFPHQQFVNYYGTFVFPAEILFKLPYVRK